MVVDLRRGEGDHARGGGEPGLQVDDPRVGAAGVPTGLGDHVRELLLELLGLLLLLLRLLLLGLELVGLLLEGVPLGLRARRPAPAGSPPAPGARRPRPGARLPAAPAPPSAARARRPARRARRPGCAAGSTWFLSTPGARRPGPGPAAGGARAARGRRLPGPHLGEPLAQPSRMARAGPPRARSRAAAPARDVEAGQLARERADPGGQRLGLPRAAPPPAAPAAVGPRLAARCCSCWSWAACCSRAVCSACELVGLPLEARLLALELGPLLLQRRLLLLELLLLLLELLLLLRELLLLVLQVGLRAPAPCRTSWCTSALGVGHRVERRGDLQRAVVADPEAGGDQVVGLPLGRVRRGRADVLLAESEREDGDDQRHQGEPATRRRQDGCRRRTRPSAPTAGRPERLRAQEGGQRQPVDAVPEQPEEGREQGDRHEHGAHDRDRRGQAEGADQRDAGDASESSAITTVLPANTMALPEVATAFAIDSRDRHAVAELVLVSGDRGRARSRCRRRARSSWPASDRSTGSRTRVRAARPCARATPRPTTAVMIGRPIATRLPRTRLRMIIAAMIPTISLRLGVVGGQGRSRWSRRRPWSMPASCAGAVGVEDVLGDLRGEVAGADVEEDRGEGRLPVVREEARGLARAAERIGDAVDVRERAHRLDRVLHRLPVRRVGEQALRRRRRRSG